MNDNNSIELSDMKELRATNNFLVPRLVNFQTDGTIYNTFFLQKMKYFWHFLTILTTPTKCGINRFVFVLLDLF
jgi:hypothetical protein